MSSELLRIRVPSNLPPFAYKEAGEATGADVEIIREIMQRMGHPVHISLIPWARMIEGVWEEQSDAVMVGSVAFSTVSENTGEMPSLLFTDVIFQSHVKAFVRSDATIHPTKLKDLEGLRVGAMRGWSYGEAVETTAISEKVRVLIHGEDMVRILDHGIIDVALMEELPMRYYQSLGDKKYDFVSTIPVFTYDIILAFSRNRLGENADSFMKKINAVIRDMQADGTIDNILSRYG